MNKLLKGLKMMNEAIEGYYELKIGTDRDFFNCIGHQMKLNRYRHAYQIIEKTAEKMIDDLSTKEA